MFTIPNFLSFLRIPLAFLFLKQNLTIRAIALALAMITDGLDGYLARRYNCSSKLGTLLDPITDRFFVCMAMGILLSEGRLGWTEIGFMVCRDVALFLFGFYLIFSGKLKRFKFRAIWCGKLTTFLQFLVFIAILFSYKIPTACYGLFLVLGVLAFVELYMTREEKPEGHESKA